jgi:hypothetical protein
MRHREILEQRLGKGNRSCRERGVRATVLAMIRVITGIKNIRNREEG